eukprot:1028884-Pelagomonas_calceolata.AAC.3
MQILIVLSSHLQARRRCGPDRQRLHSRPRVLVAQIQGHLPSSVHVHALHTDLHQRQQGGGQQRQGKVSRRASAAKWLEWVGYLHLDLQQPQQGGHQQRQHRARRRASAAKPIGSGWVSSGHLWLQ